MSVASTVSCRRTGADHRDPAPALQGTRYADARAIVQAFCAPCHTRHGQHPSQRRAYADLQLDAYQQLKARLFLIESALVVHGTHADMPPAGAPRQPSDRERALLIQWLQLGAPNTPDGR